MEFDEKQLKIIYNAVRYYQINHAPVNSQHYQTCDEILNKLFATVKQPIVEPAYEVYIDK